jgi:hypothetical protein
MKTKQDAMKEDVTRINRVYGGLMGYLNGLKLQLSQAERDMMGDNDAETEGRLLALAEDYEEKILYVKRLMVLGN